VAHETAKREDLLQRFGASVREARARAGITQEKLAELAGMHRTYVSSLERGQRNVGVVNIYVLAEALGCRASDLLT
jgi:transcriptional regulator with XRE-family HTH domain